MSYLHNMYGGKTATVQSREKNPNRVLGGLKGSGVDHYTVLGEDGAERRVPTQAYVQGLEEKVRQQDSRLAVLEKQIRRLSNDQKLDRTAFSAKINR
jgi:hypothetical protein